MAVAGFSALAMVVGAMEPNPVQAQTRRAAAAGHICVAGETPVYSCRFGARTVSLCDMEGSLAYRFGTRQRTELTIEDSANGQPVHYGNVVGHRSGTQEHLRFTSSGMQYIVYRGEDGGHAGNPTRRYSGLSVMQGSRTISNRRCAGASVSADWDFYADRVRREPAGSLYDDWF